VTPPRDMGGIGAVSESGIQRMISWRTRMSGKEQKQASGTAPCRSAVDSGGLGDVLAPEAALLDLGVPAVVQGDPYGVVQVESLAEGLADGR
jgi:hypothetical protein